MPTRAPALDLIKALAILAVISFHMFGQLAGWHMHVVDSSWFFAYFSNISWLTIPQFIEAYAFMGVNLFIIASGFGLYFSYLKGGKVFKFTEFLGKRLWRLMPAAILATIVVFALKVFLLNTWATGNWWLNFYPFLGGLNLFSDNWFFPPINGEMWFLGLMVQLYLLFPVLIWLMNKLGRNKFLILCLAVTFAFRAWYYYDLQYSVSSMAYGFSLARLGDFGFGMVVASLFAENKKPSWLWVSGLALFWGYFFQYTFPFADALLGIAIFTLLWNLFAEKNIPQILINLSVQSYLIFLLHHPFIWFLNSLGLVDMWTFLGLLGYLGVILVSYYLSKLCNLLLAKAKL